MLIFFSKLFLRLVLTHLSPKIVVVGDRVGIKKYKQTLKGKILEIMY